MDLKPASEHPGWTWIISAKGYELLGEYSTQAQNCNPNEFGMRLYY